MQIVIDIHEEMYKHTQEYESGGFNQENDAKLFTAIKNGTPLPKGHGRLIDADEIAARFKENKKFYVDSYGGFFRHMPIDYKVRCDEIDSCWADVVNAPTIIEADEEVGE